jgi:hypothetical protein
MIEIPLEEIAPPVEAQYAFDSRILELVNAFYAQPTPRIISASATAREILVKYDQDNWNELAYGDLQWIAPLVRRRGEIAWRVALVLHAFEHAASAAECDISAENAAAAVLFGLWWSSFQKQLAQQATDAGDAERLDKAMTLLKFNPGGVSARDLHRKSSLFPDTKSALYVLKELESEGGVYSRYSGKSLRFFLGARGR